MKKNILALILALAMALTLAACGGDKGNAGSNGGSNGGGNGGGSTDEYFEFNFSMHAAAESTFGTIFREFFDEIEEKTDGHVKINIYGSGTLAAAADVADMVKSGGVDMGWIFTGFYYGEYPLTDVLNLPMLGAENVEQGTNVLWDVFEEYPQVYDEWSDFKPLMIYPNPVNYFFSTKPITSMDDLHNISIRAVAGGTANMLTNVGANVITMPPNDIYDSISKNNIQAFVGEPTMVPDYSLGEVAPYRSTMGLYQAGFIVAMNRDAYNSLPAEYQAVIDEYATRAASVRYAQKMDEYVEQCNASYEAMGNTFVEMPESVEAEFAAEAEKIGQAWIETYTTDDFDAAEYYAFVKDAYAKYAPAE